VTGCRWQPAAGRVEGIGLERSASQASPRGISVDEFQRPGEQRSAIGDVNGIWPLTHVGEYEGDVLAANIAGEARAANYEEALPRVTYTDPQGAAVAVAVAEAVYSATAPLSELPKDRHLYPRLRRIRRAPDAAVRRPAAYRRLRARARSR